MQIRHNKGRTQFLRTYYDNASRRSRQKLIGSMARGSTELPPDLAAKMTDAEQLEFAAWMEKELIAERAARAAQEIDALPQQMLSAAGHIIRGVPVSTQQAKGMWDGMAQLRRTLTKAGLTKPHLEETNPKEDET